MNSAPTLTRGLTLLACACAFDGFLLQFLLVSTGLPLCLCETASEQGAKQNIGFTTSSSTGTRSTPSAVDHDATAD